MLLIEGVGGLGVRGVFRMSDVGCLILDGRYQMADVGFGGDWVVVLGARCKVLGDRVIR